ncbi:hypothetical protein [Mycobacteroides abscessus]|nr:hypothetical protein [Mycobacteroides abscessus]MDO3096821.1 hypothetical protein [Mycobacteroides abscessus subsp. abscessus]SHU23024.1 Uncharacterised protein [Mycobacteroides abscessus subsp. abscessus]SHU79465.1 Uncharacterised protein [Mycobacteroides abscessus subsp. abscessus]SHU90752.1 Uncharacterised protein [Mycobacteroides abscessus subsp. abscessus]SHW18449.1 Uncharacterised protein [Mycobacteroides abscessus subsp. abscessus]
MFSQLLRYPAFYAVIGLAGFGFGMWLRGKLKLQIVWVSTLYGRPGLDPRIGDI